MSAPRQTEARLHDEAAARHPPTRRKPPRARRKRIAALEALLHERGENDTPRDNRRW